MTTTIGEKKWLERLHQIINENIEDVYLDNKVLSAQMAISERQLFRKVKDLTDLSPQKYVRKYRLHKARHHLKQGTYRTVKEAAFSVGFVNTSYFSSQFQREFGKKPLQFLKEAGWR